MELSEYRRRTTHEVRIGQTRIGAGHPIAVQSMTNTSTLDTAASVAQIERIARAGAPIVRLTAQGLREGENLRAIADAVHALGLPTALVADIHFVPEVAAVAARYVDKVRINPGNYRTDRGQFEALIARCRERGVALRIGVNHGSLAQRIFDRWGDTPEGMVEAAMEFLRVCRREAFDQAVVSMKSSNTRVMVAAYRLLCEAMDREGMTFPLHLGVTEAGNGLEGRIKSAVGIGALLADGIGDTIRVSLTEAPENEVPVAQLLADHFRSRPGRFPVMHPEGYSPTRYRRRSRVTVPLVRDEIPAAWRLLEATSQNPTAELRAAILNLASDEPVAVARRYDDRDLSTLAVRAAADLGPLFLDGLADGLRILAPQHPDAALREVELLILQAARVRQTRTEYIACPSCGRTLYDIEGTLARIKARTDHLTHLKIGVMGCIVNGPGEMADADYGYVGAAPGRITLYKGRTVVERNIPQEEALDRLVALIKAHGDWREPATDDPAPQAARTGDSAAPASEGAGTTAASGTPAANGTAHSAENTAAAPRLYADHPVSGRSEAPNPTDEDSAAPADTFPDTSTASCSPVPIGPATPHTPTAAKGLPAGAETSATALRPKTPTPGTGSALHPEAGSDPQTAAPAADPSTPSRR